MGMHLNHSLRTGFWAMLLPLAFCSAPAVRAADSDANGKPARDYSQSSVVTRMMAFDANHDGKLTRDEITDWRFLRLFEQADTNADGVVTPQELIALATKMDAAFGASRDDFGGGPGGPGGPDGPRPEPRHVDWKNKVGQLDLSKLPPAADVKDLSYEKDVRPLLSESCFRCHGSERSRGGLRLDSVGAIQKGGEAGPVIVEHKSEQSLLVIAASQIDADTSMPPRRGGPRRGGDPRTMLASEIFKQADTNADGKVSKDEFVALAKSWFEKIDTEKAGHVSQEPFVTQLSAILHPRMGGRESGGPDGPGPRGPGGFDPARMMATSIFNAASAQKDALTPGALESTFADWFDKWDTDHAGALTEEELRNGLNSLAPMGRDRDGRQPPPGGPNGFRGPGGPEGGPPSKPLTSEQVGILRAWIDAGAK